MDFATKYTTLQNSSMAECRMHDHCTTCNYLKICNDSFCFCRILLFVRSLDDVANFINTHKMYCANCSACNYYPELCFESRALINYYRKYPEECKKSINKKILLDKF